MCYYGTKKIFAPTLMEIQLSGYGGVIFLLDETRKNILRRKEKEVSLLIF